MRGVLRVMIVVVAAFVGMSGQVADAAKCVYSPAPCGCFIGDCTYPLMWTVCCCLSPPCNSWCGCQPFGYNCATQWGQCLN